MLSAPCSRNSLNAVRWLLLYLLVAVCLPARADPAVCIRELPYEIKAGGHYSLESNLAAPGGSEGIRISASDVVLDLGGYSVSTVSVSGNAAAGICIAPAKNVVVRHGAIRGFATGVIVQGSATELNSAHLLEDLRVLDSRNEGIYVEAGCGGTAVRRCEILGIGPAPSGSAFALDLRCAFALVTECRIQSTDVGLSVMGQNCTVSANSIAAGSFGITFGPGGSGLRLNNTVLGAKTPYEGGTDAGGNQ